MKKIIVCFLLIFMISLTGCFTYHYIDAEPGSEWRSEDSFISLVIINEGRAEGILTVHGETIAIECFFGPGKTDFSIYKLDDTNGDAYLFTGDYHYDKKAETITFTIVEDQIELGQSEIVFHKV